MENQKRSRATNSLLTSTEREALNNGEDLRFLTTEYSDRAYRSATPAPFDREPVVPVPEVVPVPIVPVPAVPVPARWIGRRRPKPAVVPVPIVPVPEAVVPVPEIVQVPVVVVEPRVMPLHRITLRAIELYQPKNVVVLVATAVELFKLFLKITRSI